MRLNDARTLESVDSVAWGSRGGGNQRPVASPGRDVAGSRVPADQRGSRRQCRRVQAPLRSAVAGVRESGRGQQLSHWSTAVDNERARVRRRKAECDDGDDEGRGGAVGGPVQRVGSLRQSRRVGGRMSTTQRGVVAATTSDFAKATPRTARSRDAVMPAETLVVTGALVSGLLFLDLDSAAAEADRYVLQGRCHGRRTRLYKLSSGRRPLLGRWGRWTRTRKKQASASLHAS